MSTAKENIAKLPEYCFSEDNVTKKLIRIKAGEMGFYKAHDHPAVPLPGHAGETMDALADRLNEKLGVTKAQREAMEMGSLFGWEVPAANCDNYDENGKFKQEFLNRKSA